MEIESPPQARKAIEIECRPNEADRLWREHARLEADESRRFSLAELMLAVTITAVAMAAIQPLGHAVRAGVVGIAVFVGLFVLASGARSRLFQLSWWVLLGMYLLLAVVAMVLR